ncbi:MAG TPA: trehalose-phosphatase [Chromatiales bacterium]|nr:trehalose-phosphatase [Chromatiales bacterium]
MLPNPPARSDSPIALFLDLDGTLVDIAARPELVHAPEALLELLDRAHEKLGGALAVVSGRSIADIDRILTPLRLPAVGIHGLEYRAHGRDPVQCDAPPLPESLIGRVRDFAGQHAGLLPEFKGQTSIAIHFRAVPELEQVTSTFLGETLENLGSDYTLQKGKMVLELRPAGATKGTGITQLMAQPPFAGRRPVFIGDDVTDEDGFVAVNEAGGWSIRVGNPDGTTSARYELADIKAVRNWIATLVHDTP